MFHVDAPLFSCSLVMRTMVSELLVEEIIGESLRKLDSNILSAYMYSWPFLCAAQSYASLGDSCFVHGSWLWPVPLW